MGKLGRLLFGLCMVAGCNSTSEDPYIPWPPQAPPAWGVPVSGGTMAIHRDGTLAAVSDPDRDRILIVDLAASSVAVNLSLQDRDEPGRVVWDGADRVHVILRRGGALVTVEDGAITARRDVCAEPRGLAWDPSGDVLHVACTDGRLITLPAAGGDPIRVARLDRDLRDVIVSGTDLIVTRFRTAEVLRLNADGVLVERQRPPTVPRTTFDMLSFDGTPSTVDAVPEVAYRAIALGDGRVVVSHQRHLMKELSIQPGGYGGDCSGPVEAASTTFAAGVAPTAGRGIPFSALPVDIAVSGDGQRLAFAMAGDRSIRVEPISVLSGGDTGPCEAPPMPDPTTDPGGGGDVQEFSFFDGRGIPTSVGWLPDGRIAAFYPEMPAVALVRIEAFGVTSASFIDLPGGFNDDAGKNIFHQMTFAGLACASCHPEGRDDGQVWSFLELGVRRTQVVAGNILSRTPYHWNGDMADLDMLLNEVMVNRMGGSPPSGVEEAALAQWLDRLPPAGPVRFRDHEAVLRGKSLFESPEVGCTECHNGALYTDNRLVDVGTGGFFKVPSLRGVGARPPFLHDGCAESLMDRFTTCGSGDAHGRTSGLDEAQLSDLVAYLETI